MSKVVIHHVTPNINGGWSVRKGGSAKATRVFKNRDEAVEFAKKIARNSKTGLFIHKKDGKITKYRSFEKKSA